MFRTELSVREAELVTDVLIGLMRQAERDLRHALSEALAGNDKVPLRLVLHMANDEIFVAEPILKNSPVLNDLDLIYIIKSQGPEYWRAIAHRKVMSDKVIDLLADTEDTGTIKNLAENKNIRLSDYTVRTMASKALEEETLVGPLLRRDEIPPEIAAYLYRYAGDELRSYIEENFEIDKKLLGQSIDKAVRELSGNNIDIYVPDQEMLDNACNLQQDGELRIYDMIAGLRQGNIRDFVARFSVYAELPPRMVVEMLSQNYGHGLALACKALDIEKADFLTMYFLTQRVRKPTRIADKHDISRALAFYDRAGKEAARRLLVRSRSK
jgi:uncharacterized protein (DUF2336 family)